MSEITFKDFGTNAGELDEGVLDRLLEFSKKLTKLTVSSMRYTSVENKKSLLYMSEKIYNLRPPLTHLIMSSIFK